MASEVKEGLRPKTAASARSARSVRSRRGSEGLKALRYEETVAAKPPIPVTIAPPRSPPMDIHPALRRPATSAEQEDPRKRDSGLAPTESTAAREGSLVAGDESSLLTTTNSSLAQTNGAVSPVIPKSPDKTKSEGSSMTSRWRRGVEKKDITMKRPHSEGSKSTKSEEKFSPLTTPIPTESQLELDFMNQISFSNRGSVLLQGKKAVNGQHRQIPVKRKPSLTKLASSDSKLLSEELELESQKVRSMYEIGQPTSWSNGRMSAAGVHTVVDQEGIAIDQSEPHNESRELSTLHESTRPNSSLTTGGASTTKMAHELAGGIEDWEDINGGDVDRYGFITIRKQTENRTGSPEPRQPQRVSTVLQLASQTPRRRRGLGRTLSSSRSSRSVIRRAASRKVSQRSLITQDTGASKRSSTPSQTFRSAANRLPGNRDRRWMDEAGDMLTLPPGLADIAEEEEGGRAVEGAKRKEWNRAEKWRKMAKAVKPGNEGEGTAFEFDVRNPKLIERTWKGIPDRWRAAAWYSFLSTSAKKRPGGATDAEILEVFHELLEKSSADDVQIDMDVPRTINSHIMFRRRYRGGQRLLFRVLHALSLYFPDTGYVQGMASLAATLLCYYDEEKTFIMLVRMWQLRGMDKLYESGFPGLTAALDEFRKEWMSSHAVTKKLNDLDIDVTAYGIRWYLTLFNYSIPFAAQLRVWDVFMLLGDAQPALHPPTPERPFSTGLDVLHAASAALIDGTRDILLDSDFENSMKALTSWIPVKDEDLFMRVARAEWRLRRGKGKGKG